MTGDRAAMLPCDAGEARRLTDRIKVGVDAVWGLVCEAYERRAWSALGYSSWDDYCTREIGTSRLRLPREERAEVVASLRESGLSIRAIASATGDSIGTVHEALSTGVQNRSPAPAGDALAADPVDAPLIDFPEQHLPPLPENYMQPDDEPEPEPEPRPIIGLDGKTYPRTAPKPAVGRRPSILDTARNLSLDLTKLIKRLESLSADDRLAKNKADINARIGHQLGLAVEVCQDLNNQLAQGA